MSSKTASDRLMGTRWGFLCALAGLVIAVVGYWGPWVDHLAAALVIPGFDLAEFVKFLPEVRAGTVAVTRELFYLPAPMAGLCLALVTSWQRGRLPEWATALLTILAMWLALVVAPPPDFILRFVQDAAMRAEWGRQALLAVGAWPLVVAALIWTRRLPRFVVPFCISLSAGAGVAVSLWQFLAVRPAIDRVYNKPVTLGWGVWLMPLGFGLVVIAAWWQALFPGDKG